MLRIALTVSLALLAGALLLGPPGADAQNPPPRRRAAAAPSPGGGNACAGKPADMVCVSAGTLRMGSSVGDHDELPVHEVTLDEFLIDKTEVSFGEYMQCVKAQKCDAPRYYPPLSQRKVAGSRTENIKQLPRRRGARPRRGRKGEPAPRRAAPRGPKVVKVKVSTLLVDSKLPVAGITWLDAYKYCQFRGKHLPTEAQWEYAARGSSGNYFAWGGEPPTCERVNSKKCGKEPKRVSSLPKGASPFGALHMTGNVWEWVHDWYSAGFYRQSAGARNPTGPANTRDPTTNRWRYRYRILRGGSWSGIPNELRTTYRYRLLPTMYANDIGFRCARSNLTLPPPPAKVLPKAEPEPPPSEGGAWLPTPGSPRSLAQLLPRR
jgi:formylglycine-generating enzyme required for sulfatase activity